MKGEIEMNKLIQKAGVSFVVGLATAAGSIVSNHVYKKAMEASNNRKKKKAMGPK